MALAAIALLDAILGAYTGLHLSRDSEDASCVSFIVIYTLLAVAMRRLGATFLKRYQSSCESVALMMEGLAQFILFVPIFVFFSYVAAGLFVVPYADAALLQADKALGFDWLAYVQWVDNHPLAAKFFIFGYSMWGPVEVVLIFAGLALLRRSRRLYGMILAAIICAFICIAVSSLVPAQGFSAYNGITSQQFSHLSVNIGFVQVKDLDAIREHSLHAISAGGFKGLVTFPSYHSCLALILTWGAWAVPGLRWIALFFNGFMLIATPVIGGHYLIDTLCGSIIALSVLYALRRLGTADDRGEVGSDSYESRTTFGAGV